MRNNYFDFKQFRITQHGAAMRVNTDGVLLGAWVETGSLLPNDYVLDIGTGTGVIALMLAQRTLCRIDAVEIDSEGAADATENALSSRWSDRIEIYNSDIRTFKPSKKYKLIVSNPPYFVGSLTSPIAKRTSARHANDLTYSDLIDVAVRLLDADGTIAVILPAESEQKLFCSIAAKKELYLHRITEVCSLPDTPPKRVLMEFRRGVLNTLNGTHIQRSSIVIEDKNGYTLQYRELTKDFYLKF